jgi:histidyl-tRNA synthetase
LDAGSAAHFEELRALLEAAGVQYTVNPRLMRGLDYYTRTVFEWVSDELGAQSAVCAGGRYDGLVEQLGGRPTPAAGFAIGLERVLDLMEQQVNAPEVNAPDVFLAAIGRVAGRAGYALAERIRDELENITLMVNSGGGNLKAQLRRADRAGARLALILGEDEIASNTITVKHLRQKAEQRIVAQSELAHALNAALGTCTRSGAHERNHHAAKMT